MGCRGGTAGKPPAWDETAADKLWDDLASKDAAKAFAAIRLLRANPDKAVPLFKERTKLVSLPENLKQLLADVGSEDFASARRQQSLSRRSATRRGRTGAGVGRATVPEAKKRLGELLVRLDAATPSRLRLVRTVEVVEGINSPDATALLEAWAGGTGGVPLAAEAKAALRRLTK